MVEINILTRKSCVNARDIPTVAYQVLHLLSYPRGWGYPIMGYPLPVLTSQGYLIPGWGVPHHGYPLPPS